MFGLNNLDLLSVGVAVAAVAILGVIIYLSDRNSSTNKSFLFFSIVTILWGIFNYISYNTDSPVFVLWSFRLVMFFAVFHAFALFQLFYVFPAAKAVYSKYYKFVVIPAVVVTASLTLTSFVFPKLAELSSTGSVSKTVVEKGIVVFGVTVISLILFAIGILIRKILIANSEERRRFWPILLGTTATFSLLIIFNFILPGLFLYVRFIPLGAVFILPFAFATFYAIYKHKLFNVKVLAASLLVFALTILTFSEVILAGGNVTLILYRSSVFVLVLVFGILLIRGVLREVEQREKLQVLTEELSVANAKLKELDRAKTEFVSIASHQLRAPLTAIKGYASLLLEGSFGPMTDKVHGAIDIILQSSQRLVQLIEDFLNITRIELGKMKYDMADFDFKKLAESITNELRPSVEKAGLQISFAADPGSYTVHADQGKISQVVTNLIDNATKYTKQGGIAVSVVKSGAKTQLRVKDTGVGLSRETIDNLFQKFVRATDASKANATGTGLGLFVARQIVEAHGGKVWAESEGVGKGSTFIMEL